VSGLVYMVVTGDPWVPEWKSKFAQNAPHPSNTEANWEYLKQAQIDNAIDGAVGLATLGVGKGLGRGLRRVQCAESAAARAARTAPQTVVDFGPKSAHASRLVPQSPDMSKLYGVGGQPYGKRRLDLLKRYLDKRGVDLVIDENAVGGRFIVSRTGRPQFVVGPNSRTESVWHELGHYIHWRRVGGSEKYLALPREFGNNVPEQFVFDLLQQPTRWERLSPEYRLRSVEYIVEDWGGMGR